MNDANTTGKTVATGAFRPRLSYYHPNARGTGCAVQFELHPAHESTSGSIFASFARQKSTGSYANGQRQFPSFDWTNRVCVKLDISDLSQILQVFRGMQESLADGKGLFPRSERGNTVIKLEHRIDPQPGYFLEVWKKPLEGEAVNAGLLFTPTEALGLSLAIEQSMDVIAFGIPMVIAREAVDVK